MPFESEQEAAEALLGAIEQDKAANQDSPAFRAEPVADPTPVDDGGGEQAEPPQQDGSEAEGTTDAPEQPDSFTGIDPSTLPDELVPLYRSMQADYTRKRQADAERERSFSALEEFGGVDAAREAVEFVTRLASEPEYALEVHGELTKALVEAGMSPQQASQTAAQQVSEAAATATEDEDDFGLVDSETKQRLSSLEQELEAQKQWRAEQEERRLQDSMWAELERQQAEVIRDYGFKDEELDYVYKLAYSTGGDLKTAAADFATLQQAVLSNYMDKKATTPPPGDTLPTDSSAQQPPQKFTDLNDPALERLAQERLRKEGFDV